MLHEKKARFKQLPNTIPFIAQSGKDKLLGQKADQWLSGLGVGVWKGMTTSGSEKTFWNDKNVLFLSHGDIERLCICQNPYQVTEKKGKLHVNHT